MKLRNKNTKEVGLLRNIAFSLLGDVATIQLIIEIDGYNITRYYHTLSEVYAEWEDYAPAEPLIKDENIRKAVKFWAYINSVKTATYDEMHYDRGLNVFFFEDTEEENAIIQFYGWIPTIKEGEIHTIAELCGEEE